KAQRVLQIGHWQEALALGRPLHAPGLSAAWQRRLRLLEAECHRTAMRAWVAAKEIESALGHALKAAQILPQPEAEARVAILATMLAEVRALFATPGVDIAAIHQLLGRILLIQNPCLEAHFWQGLCHLRDGHIDKAMIALRTARTGEGALSLTENLA